MCQMASYELLTRSAYAAASELHRRHQRRTLGHRYHVCALSGVVSTLTSQLGTPSCRNEQKWCGGGALQFLHAIREVCVSEVYTVEECCETEGGECRLLEVCAPRKRALPRG